MSKPRVLAFIDWYRPYFKAGGPVRSMVNLVDHLGDAMDIHIITGDRDYMASDPSADQLTDKWVRLGTGEQVWYASPGGRSLGSWRTLLKSDHWDVVYINGLYSVWSTIVPLWLLKGSAQRRVVAVRGMLAPGPMRQAAWKKRAFLAVMKALGCFKGIEFQGTTEQEVKEIRHWFGPDAAVHLAPNLARRADPTTVAPMAKRPGELHLVSLGRIAEEKNTLFAIERLAGVKGQVRFDLYGTIYDQAYHARCEQAVAALPAGIEVTWQGQLDNEQVPDVLGKAHALFMPSVGENFGHTMLEALTAGRPMIISDRTPWKELESQQAGWDLGLQRPARFTEVLQGLVDADQQHYDILAEGALRMGLRYLNDPGPVELNKAMFRV